MKRLVILLSLVSLSCSRKVTDKLLVDEKETISYRSTDSIYHSMIDSVMQVSISESNFEFSTIVYSAPDSLGNQYPVSVTTGKARKKDSVSTSNISTSTIQAKNDEELSYADTIKEKRETTTKVNPYVPSWCYLLSLVCIVLVVLYIIVWVKKKGFY